MKGRAKPVAADYTAKGPELFTLPSIDLAVRFGVLRRMFSGRENCPALFVWTKLNPLTATRTIDGHLAERWSVTATRADVILPAAADDSLIDPAVLMRSYLASLPPGQKDLLVSIKLILSEDEALHAQWEAVRDFARSFLAAQSLAVVAVLHDPGKTGSRAANPPHVHLLSPASRLMPGGWRGGTDLACDEAHELVVSAWRAQSR